MPNPFSVSLTPEVADAGDVTKRHRLSSKNNMTNYTLVIPYEPIIEI
jgi:hypothetical protein